jgi:hypothetical protein
MDSFKDGESFQHPSFLQMFFHIDDQTTSTQIEEMLRKRKKKKDTFQGDYGVMQHFLFCSTSLKKGTGSLARYQSRSKTQKFLLM